LKNKQGKKKLQTFPEKTCAENSPDISLNKNGLKIQSIFKIIFFH